MAGNWTPQKPTCPRCGAQNMGRMKLANHIPKCQGPRELTSYDYKKLQKRILKRVRELYREGEG